MLKRKMMIHFMVFLILVTLIVIIVRYRLYVNDYKPTAYENELIDYFEEVALQSEFYDNPRRIIKWSKPMRLYINKDDLYNEQVRQINKVVRQINKLVTDGFVIEIVDEISKANAIIYLSERKRVSELAPNFYKLFSEEKLGELVSGFTYIEFSWDDYRIKRAFIYVDPEEPIEIQKSVILEEITQSIGLPNDSKKYPVSIFYEGHSDSEDIVKEYSEIDKDLIKLLYSTEIKSGYNYRSCRKAIKKVLSKK